MDRHRQLWRFAPLAAAGIALSAATAWNGTATGLQSGEIAALALLGTGAALHRLGGWPSLGMGACMVPLAIESSGAVVAALLAALVITSRQAIGWLLEQEIERVEGGTEKVVDILLSVGPAMLAVLVAAWVGRGLPTETSDAAGAVRLGELTDLGALAGLGRMALAGAVYLALFAGLTLLSRFGSRGIRGEWRNLRPLLYDALGWASGLALALAVTRLGWPAGLLLAAPVVVVSAAALGTDLRVRREIAVSNRLRHVHLAGHRIIFRQPDLPVIAAQICSECRDLVPFAWFHLKLRDPEGRDHHWSSGPDGAVDEGTPEPPESPPAATRLGRRASWRIVSRNLSTGERLLGQIKLWCDPRKVAEGDLDWLDAFLPEISSAIERAFLSREARHDPLTGLADRRVLENRLDAGFHRSLSRGVPMSVIMVDLDHFKNINDRHGHAIGDQALITVTRVLEEHRRETDVCCRYGGEEFALVLEDSDGETALAVAERIRRAVETTPFAPAGSAIPLRLSAGVASFPQLPMENGRRLVELADEALYEAKRQGRNRCLLHLGTAGFASAGARAPLSLVQ